MFLHQELKPRYAYSMGEASMKMVLRTTSGSSKSGLEAAESVPWYLLYQPLESKRGKKRIWNVWLIYG